MDETGRPDRGRSHGRGRASKRGRLISHKAFMRRVMAQARSKFPSDAASETAPGDSTVSLAAGSAGGHSGATDLRLVDSTAHWSQPLLATSTNPLLGYAQRFARRGEPIEHERQIFHDIWKENYTTWMGQSVEARAKALKYDRKWLRPSRALRSCRRRINWFWPTRSPWNFGRHLFSLEAQRVGVSMYLACVFPCKPRP